jgi:hypothetical protein
MPPISPMVFMPCNAQWIEAGILAQEKKSSASTIQQGIGFGRFDEENSTLAPVCAKMSP